MLEAASFPSDNKLWVMHEYVTYYWAYAATAEDVFLIDENLLL